MKIKFFTVGVAIMLMTTGCQPAGQTQNKISTSEAKKETSPEKNSKQPEKDPKQVAMAAKEALFTSLSSRLMEAMGNGGPAAAIEVCGREAPKIAARVGKEHGVSIGRTSFKLRNPKNAPPEWVTPLIENRPTDPQFVDLPDHHTGALLPILLKVQCLACHGPNDKIAEDVQVQLAKLYPDDQAVGFNEGDLRGWFWVDVPGRANPEEPKSTSGHD